MARGCSLGCRREHIERLLKTDLFDEALTTGLYPLLVGTSASRLRRRHLLFDLASRGRTQRPSASRPGRCALLPFADGAFGGIVSNSTLDHFASTADIVSALAELYRVLRSGGRLLLTLDNLANPVVALRNALPSRLLNRSDRALRRR